MEQLKIVCTCKKCGKIWIKPVTKGRIPKYCSSKCRPRYPLSGKVYPPKWVVKICLYCGVEYRTQNGHVQKFCSLECAAKNTADVKKDNRPAHQCRKCGKHFYRPKRNTDSYVYCSRKCAGNGRVGIRKEAIRVKTGSARKRAKAHGVEYEEIDILSVFERDMWRCQICGKKTPKENRGTKYSNAPEIDHRTPISKGGNHKYDNVQCACRSCNLKKSNKNNFGQLPMFDARKPARRKKCQEAAIVQDQGPKKEQSIRKGVHQLPIQWNQVSRQI